MYIVSGVLKIVLLTGVLTLIARQSYNLIFFQNKKPSVWIIMMAFTNIALFLVGAVSEFSLGIICITSFLTLISIAFSTEISNYPISKTEFMEAVYLSMKINQGRLKYKLGLIAYIIGGVLGGLIFYGKLINI